ncbi:hypothetical protein [Streptomyces sp. ISL-94]|uniref:hypothetical protein n=1 Tax=Streptomyces sp. ISL-94 TaxID=2819190 RepID=UPI001BE8652D|nr:hypothetical protein [Streptomyces sp. ISL-94]MBT2476868.1 hypothetical protein [Streptomyces sp. ISL-94]
MAVDAVEVDEVGLAVVIDRVQVGLQDDVAALIEQLGDVGPLVLELELCEPSFSMPFSEPSATRFAQAISVRLEEISQKKNGQS